MLAFRPKGASQKRQPRDEEAAPRSAVVAAAAVAAVTARATPLAQPLRAQADPQTRVAAQPPVAQPPPWLDAPFEDEIVESNSGAVAVADRSVETFASKAIAAATVAAVSFVPTALGARWAELVRGLIDAGSISAFARELAMQSQCVALDEAASPIACRLRVERETLRAPAQCEKLQAALSDALKRPVRLEVEAGAAEDSPAKRDAAENARRQAQAEQIIHDDPLVQALMAQYKTARIVPGSVKPH